MDYYNAPGSILKWSLLGSHPWMFWISSSEEEDGIMLIDLKDWVEKQSRYSGLHQVEFLLVYLRMWTICLRIICYAYCMWTCISLDIVVTISGRRWGIFSFEKLLSWDLCVPAFPSSNYWSSSKREHYNILQIVAKFENTSLGHVKTIRTELIFLISWGIIHKVSLWILRKISKIKSSYWHE